jgi:hypothetical protein
MLKNLFLLFFFVQLNLESVEFVLFTQPKSGTHLLIPILTELTQKNVYWAKEYTQNVPHCEMDANLLQGPEYFPFTIDRMPWDRLTMDEVWDTNKKNGTFLHLHAPYSTSMEAYLTEKNCINFFIKRDPRDQIVSLLNHYNYIHCNDPNVEVLPTNDEKLLYLIKKESKAHTIRYMNWLNSSICCNLDFEKLMGSHGESATDNEAMAEMRKIASALKLDLSDSYLEAVYKKHFGHGWNFFKGKVGVWKEYFNEQHKTLIKSEIGDELIQLGYEKNYDW